MINCTADKGSDVDQNEQEEPDVELHVRPAPLHSLTKLFAEFFVILVAEHLRFLSGMQTVLIDSLEESIGVRHSTLSHLVNFIT
jgi:hypothetical protein